MQVNLSSQDPIGQCCQLIDGFLGLTFFVLACVGAAGHFTAYKMGSIAVGFGTTILVTGLLKQSVTNCPAFDKTLNTIAAIVFIILGALAMGGVLTGKQVGWGVIGTIFAPAGLLLAGCCGVCCCAVASGIGGGSSQSSSYQHNHYQRPAGISYR